MSLTFECKYAHIYKDAGDRKPLSNELKCFLEGSFFILRRSRDAAEIEEPYSFLYL